MFKFLYLKARNFGRIYKVIANLGKRYFWKVMSSFMDGVIMIDSNFLSLQTSFSTLSDKGMNRLNRIFESFYYDFSQTKLLFKSSTNLLSTTFEDFGLGLIHSPICLTCIKEPKWNRDKKCHLWTYGFGGINLKW